MAWMGGALNYFNLCSIKVEFPCFAIILGTGVGLSYSNTFDEIEGIEASEQKQDFPHLSKASNKNVYDGTVIHKVLGTKFFGDVRDKYKEWTYIKIQNEYTNRIIGLLRDMDEKNICNFKDVRSIIIGGGNSRYVCLQSLKNCVDKSIYMVSEDSLQINPDLIPLLGLVPSINQHLVN